MRHATTTQLPSFSRALLGLATGALLAAAPVSGQSPVPRTPASQPATVPALFLSDIHLNPFNDPSKAARLNAAPLAEWGAILGAPDSPTQPHDYAALQTACPVNGIDTTDALWHSSLRAIHTHAGAPSGPVKFVTVGGDLLGHAFDCKFRTLLPKASHADYLAFIEKTIRYEIDGLHSALPGVPIYITLGNNDTACADYQLAPTHDEFLALAAPLVLQAIGDAAGVSAADRQAILTDFTSIGAYNAPLPAIPNTRILSLDDLFDSAHYATCANQPNPAPAASQLAWLEAQFAAAREQHRHIWILGHIPPTVDLLTTVKRSLRNPNQCDPKGVALYLRPDPDLAALLAANSDVISLALFGHTHIDEFHLFTSTSNPDRAGVPAKSIGSITPTEGQRPTFTLAKIDPATAKLQDYTVIIASNLNGIAATWAPEYTYSTTYHQPAFDAPALTTLISGFQADPSAATPAAAAYLRNIYAGDANGLVRIFWPQFACAMDHTSAAAFSACTCANSAQH